MPLTPHGGPTDSLSPRVALLLGGLALIGGVVVAVAGIDRPGGLAIAGFGLLLLAWGGLMRPDVELRMARLLLLAGVAGGLMALVGAVLLLL